MNIFKKIPSLDDIAAVYAVIVVMIYAPTINLFFWKLPSWVLFSTLGDLLNIFFYAITVNFIESLMVIAAVVFLCMVLPSKWFYDHFCAKGVMLVLLTLGFLIYLGSRMQPEMPFPWDLVRGSPVIFLCILVAVFLLDKIDRLGGFLQALANRFVVFLFLSIPVSVVALLVVFMRNIF